MMRFGIIFWFIFWAGCTTPETCRIDLTGEIEGCKYGTALLVSADSARNILFSSEIDGGKISLEGDLPEPGEYILKINHLEYPLLLEAGRTKVALDIASDRVKLTEGKVMEMEQLFKKWMDERYKPEQERIGREYWEAQKHPEDKVNLDKKTFEYFDLEKLKYNVVRDFIKEYPDRVFSVYQALEMLDRDYERGMEMYALLSPGMQQSVLGKRLYAETQVFAASALGNEIPPIEVETEEGEAEVIEHFPGIWVLDFWASWCGPCRKEMVYLKEMYREVHKFGVNMISISMDDKVAAWKKGNAEEQIPWKSVRNKYGFKSDVGICSQLRFNSIPYIVLVKDGRIVARNLRRGHLKEKIMELLQE
ncbi:TlpA disulfide reductase family protein [Butyricimonas synergistica]|uniref:TlpA disulfide reductase family protein n=1 Tax=Butyricimonas synergistica TaxID=544644 RepID=UPI000370BC5B|nr:TlpA disulfide reductase family protein [Butyricimonas synergistica]